jgi:hypothetical protein
MSSCPVCSYARDTDPEHYLDKIKRLPYKGYHFNPGGAALIFDFGEVQISAECNKCDYEKLLKKLGELK